MKKQLTKYLALFTIITVTLLACQKDNEPVLDTSSTTETTQKAREVNTDRLQQVLREYNGRHVEVNFIGRVIDDNNRPIQGADVSLGGQTQTTDQNGIVAFMGASVNENFAYARAYALGYTNGSRVMVPNTGNNPSTFTIKLFSLERSQTISSDGGEVAIRTGTDREAYIHFQNGFVDENGNPYSGNVSVSANYLDPLSEDTANTMPGELYGIDANFQEVALGSYGMVNVELRGSANEKLQITNPAILKLPIHPNQLATATAQVPMWSFNEDTGVWFEETVANRSGDYYVAEVNHFSFWNCDAPFPVVNFDATVTDASTGNAVAGLKVTITYNGFSRFAITNSNSSGNVSGKIPSGQVMTITITDDCGTVLYNNTNFGPFNSTTSITIPVNLTPNSVVNVTGTVLDCTGAPVTNGYVTYSNGGQFLATYLVNAGVHNYNAISCSVPVNIDIVGADFSTAQAITPTTVTANPNATANLVACGGLAAEYIRYSINGAPLQYELINPGGGIQGPNFIFLKATSTTNGTYIYGNTTVVGGPYPFSLNISATSPPAFVFEGLGDINGINHSATAVIPGAVQFIITNFGPVGTYMDVEFVGNYVDRFGTPKFIEGNAHIIRDY